MRILIVMSGGFDTYGPSRHLYDALIEDLLNSGNQVHLVESHSSGKDPDAPEKFLNNKNFSYETIDTPVVKKKAFVKRYLSGVGYCLKVKRSLSKINRDFDVVMMQSCPWAPFMASIIKKKINAPLIWNIQDMFPGSSIANGVMKNRLLQKAFFKLQKIAYKKADHISVISDDMKLKVIEQGVEENKISVIVNWFDDTSVREIKWEDNRFVKKYSLDENKFYVQYAGTMGFNFDYKMVIELAKLLKGYEDIVFQMVGFGSRKEDFEREASNNGLVNIEFLPIQPQDMVSDVYSSCNLCLIPLPRGVIGNSVPSKAGLLMACKRAIITSSDENSFYNKMINENQIGFAFGTTDYQAVANSIIDLYNDRNKCKAFGINGYNYGHKLYSRAFNTRKYMDLFDRLAGKNI